jgi:hypothetical protein
MLSSRIFSDALRPSAINFRLLYAYVNTSDQILIIADIRKVFNGYVEDLDLEIFLDMVWRKKKTITSNDNTDVWFNRFVILNLFLPQFQLFIYQLLCCVCFEQQSILWMLQGNLVVCGSGIPPH